MDEEYDVRGAACCSTIKHTFPLLHHLVVPTLYHPAGNRAGHRPQGVHPVGLAVRGWPQGQDLSYDPD